MKSVATRRFWDCYHRLPPPVQRLADKTYGLWRRKSDHPSLHFKRLKGSTNRFSIRVGLCYRALGHRVADGVEWVWIGTHAEYDHLLRRRILPVRLCVGSKLPETLPRPLAPITVAHRPMGAF